MPEVQRIITGVEYMTKSLLCNEEYHRIIKYRCRSTISLVTKDNYICKDIAIRDITYGYILLDDGKKIRHEDILSINKEMYLGYEVLFISIYVDSKHL